MEPDEMMTAADVAAKLRISVDTVYRMIRTQKWQATKIGSIYRFTPEQYATIIAPPAPKQQRPRTQRQRIDQLLRSA